MAGGCAAPQLIASYPCTLCFFCHAVKQRRTLHQVSEAFAGQSKHVLPTGIAMLHSFWRKVWRCACRDTPHVNI